MEIIGATAAIADGKNLVATDLCTSIHELLTVKLNLAISELPQSGRHLVSIGEADNTVYITQS